MLVLLVVFERNSSSIPLALLTPHHFVNDSNRAFPLQIEYARLRGMNLTYLEAVTSDGWVLELWRMRSMDIYDEKLSTPVVVAHALGTSAFLYMTDLRNQSTAFILADNGYDTYLLNFRTSPFSNKIKTERGTRAAESEDYHAAA